MTNALTTMNAINPVARIGTILNLLLTFLEKISDENIWKNILGERLVNLGQKYFGNDFVALSLAFYIAPILRTHWTKLVERIFKKADPPGYVTIKIYSSDNLYNIVSKYAFEHGNTKDKLSSGIAMYNGNGSMNTTYVDNYEEACWDEWDDVTNYSEASSMDDSTIKVQLLPPADFDEELNYKGHVVKVVFKDAVMNENERDEEHIAVSMLDRDTKLLHVILQEWSDEYNKTQRTRDIWRSDQYNWKHERELPQRDMDSIHLKKGQMEHLMMDMQTFKKKADWYTKRGIPHRRGYLLYGPPGTGKTSTIQAIANHLDYNIAIMGALATTTNDNLLSLIRSVPHNSIVVIEDIDHLFENNASDKEKKDTLTMSGLLNVLDGMQSQEGSMIFMTCNNLNKITPALLRPGRIDVKLKFDYAAPEQVRDTYWRFMRLDEATSLPIEGDEKEKAQEFGIKFGSMIPSDKITTAEIQSFFIDLLLEANSLGWTRDEIYQHMFERIPEFLKKVEFDREQAEKHRKEKNHKKSENASTEEVE
ncbi:putative NRPS-like protein biosynthetic cluster [Mucor velutinosus]|uniref:NRPS-like protein biosynthetic cluster n=1 Tax=Mucor velutinosus TaxID=708070 RepID=A0AAN7DAV8_9FUNG|nr:putative NRPS-like protein biosynthetic cluster [Mucor velutinosus]